MTRLLQVQQLFAELHVVLKEGWPPTTITYTCAGNKLVASGPVGALGGGYGGILRTKASAARVWGNNLNHSSPLLQPLLRLQPERYAAAFCSKRFPGFSVHEGNHLDMTNSRGWYGVSCTSRLSITCMCPIASSCMRYAQQAIKARKTPQVSALVVHNPVSCCPQRSDE